MKPKDIEDIIYKALDEHKSKRENWALEIDDHLQNAFDYLRLKPLNEQIERNSANQIKKLDGKIFERDKALDNLRGYITFLENRIVELKMSIGDYQD